jgi:acetolactate synthase I/II/III large subunit
MKTAQKIVQFLADHDTKYVFGIPGGTIAPLIDALQDEPRLELIVSRHEAAAAYTAAAYGKASGKLPVVVSCSGPGATNLMTGVASAMREHIPMLVITGQVPLSRMGFLAAQEASPWTMDMCRAFEPFTKKSVLINQADTVEYALYTAARIALQHPQGPVHLSLPVDILSASSEPSQASQKLAFLTHLTGPSHEAKTSLADFLTHDNGVVFVGAGAKKGPILAELLTFCEKIGWPVVTSPAGKGAFPELHPLAAGVFGLASNERARTAICRSERVLVLGSGLGEVATSNWSETLFANKLIAQVDVTPENIGRTYAPFLPIVCCIEVLIKEMNQILPHQQNGKSHSLDDLPKLESPVGIIPQHLESFRINLPSNALLYSDIGEHMTWAIRYWRADTSDSFDISINYGGMGSGIAGALGRALAQPRRTTACITGDGCLAMHGAELLTARYHHIPVIFLVLNNNGYGMVNWGQSLLYGRAPSQLTNHAFDVMSFAKACGAGATRISNLVDWKNLELDQLWDRSGPFVIEVVLPSEQEVPPMADRVKLLRG